MTSSSTGSSPTVWPVAMMGAKSAIVFLLVLPGASIAAQEFDAYIGDDDVNGLMLLAGRSDAWRALHGKVADIVAVYGDPLTDVRALEHVRFVMHAGSIVIDRPRPQ